MLLSVESQSVAVAQNKFIISSGIIISLDLSSDTVNIFVDSKNLHMDVKRVSFIQCDWTVTHYKVS